MSKQEVKKENRDQQKKTKILEKERAQEAAEQTAKSYSSKTLRAFSAVRKSNTNLFISIREAYDALFVPGAKTDSNEMLAFNIYKLKVLTVCDRSSFNKIVSICSNDLIMNNLDRLPVAWSTLSKLDAILKTDDEATHEYFIELLDTDKINVKSTANSVVALFSDDDDDEEAAAAAESHEPVVSYDSRAFTDAQNEQIAEALEALVEVGFTIEDRAAEVEDDNEERSA